MEAAEVPGRHYHLRGQERPERDHILTAGERREKERTQQEVWAEQVRFEIRRDARQAEGWADLEHRLKKHGLRLKKRGRGLVVTDGKRMVKASRIDRGSSYGRPAERFGATYDQFREDRRELLQTLDRLERQKRLKSELCRQQQRYGGESKQARRRLERLDRSRAGQERLRAALTDAVKRAYRPADVPAAQRRLEDILERQGWDGAARVLGQEPQWLGRLRGFQLARWGTEQRIAADKVIRNAARTAGSAGVAQWMIQREEREVPKIQQQYEHAQAQLKWIERRLRRLPAKLILQRQVERLALRIGLKAVDLTLPRPAALTVKAVVKTLDRLRDTGRSRGR